MFSIHTNLPSWLRWTLSLALFVALVLLYQQFSLDRHALNPGDKLAPNFSQLADGFRRSALEADANGDYRLLVDTAASGRRVLISMLFVFAGILAGVYMGLFPVLDKLLYSFVLFLDKIPALALLPILFIFFGLGELSKIALIVIGVLPTVILDIYLRVKAFPREQLIKAMTLKASTAQIIYKIVLPQIFPYALDTIRLNFKSVILFLIAGEALAATEGLGYRIFVVRRYLAMDVIIPYVVWIALLAFVVDALLRLWIKRSFSWINK
ncbi:ABC transporter permease subunit [Paraflavisolibacter sp. H34]|uniref:ABC transporter permease n=1 Tax=Huijunlia imazamoxiresistens TaxID=3127457 RepID=UPI00301B5880